MSRHRYRSSEDAREARTKAIALWERGLSTSAIGERLGRTQNTVSTWLREAGIKASEVPRHRFDGEAAGSIFAVSRVRGRT